MKNKSGGIDNISVKTIKTISDYIVKPLTYIFNKCMEKLVWPDSLKKAEVIPIYKAEDKRKIENYRPISLISNLVKIFERLTYTRLYNFLDKFKILSSEQFGFIKNRGTTDALKKITNILYNKLDKSKPIIITFLDLAKAFDTVNHDILLKKLYRYGIRGKAFELLQSYLSNREQRVKINESTSKYEILNTGVPQGTILGHCCLFYILMIF